MITRSPPARIAAIFLLLLGAGMPVLAAGPTSAIALGARLYRRGIDTAGHPAVAVSSTGQPVIGAQAHCVTCHRPSGFGASEGGIFIPPITGPTLFAPTRLNRYNWRFADMFKQVQPPGYYVQLDAPQLRPAYTQALLTRLLRRGVAADRKKIATMPRYRLGAQDVAALMAYLKTLSAHPSPGVGAHSIWFATIFTDNVPPARRQAVLATMRAFVHWTNRNTNGDLHRPGFSPFYRSGFASSYRRWRLRVWTLHGPPSGWQAQLAADLAAHPVFAEVGGLVDGPWHEIGQFCDAQRLPCLFPQTELPSLRNGIDVYSIHFTDGLVGEARTMAAFLAHRAPPPRLVRELVGPGPFGAAPAAAFAASLARRLPGPRLLTVPVRAAADWAAAARRAAGPADALVVWPGAAPAPALAALTAARPAARRILLPEAATAAAAHLPAALAWRARFTHPTVLPTAIHPESFRTRGWLLARGVPVTARNAQFRTFYAMRVLRAAVNRLVSDFYRDYLIEWVEIEAENSLDPGVYPHLSLAPGERHASRGAYVVRFDSAAKGGIRAVGHWIVP